MKKANQVLFSFLILFIMSAVGLTSCSLSGIIPPDVVDAWDPPEEIDATLHISCEENQNLFSYDKDAPLDIQGVSRRREEGVTIIDNTAHGKIVDARALYDALRSDHLAAAGVDVWPTEPPPDRDPLIKAWKAGESWIRHRFTLTPHSAFFCRAAWEELRTKGALEVKRVLRGEKPRGCVNEEWLVNPRYKNQS